MSRRAPVSGLNFPFLPGVDSQKVMLISQVGLSDVFRAEKYLRKTFLRCRTKCVALPGNFSSPAATIVTVRFLIFFISCKGAEGFGCCCLTTGI